MIMYKYPFQRGLNSRGLPLLLLLVLLPADPDANRVVDIAALAIVCCCYCC